MSTKKKQPKKFHVFTNLAISIDGKISTYLREHIDPSRPDRALMDYHRSRAHAVIIGAGTLRTFKRPATVDIEKYRRARRSQGLNIHPINVVLARTIDFSTEWAFFRNPKIERVLVVPQKTPETKLKRFRALAHIFKYSEKKPLPEQVISYLQTLGCKNALIEGGGGILFDWVERNAVDEWNVTVSPKIIGGEDAPTMVEGRGFDARHIRFYRLKSMQRSGDELFLQYVRKDKNKT